MALTRHCRGAQAERGRQTHRQVWHRAASWPPGQGYQGQGEQEDGGMLELNHGLFAEAFSKASGAVQQAVNVSFTERQFLAQ